MDRSGVLELMDLLRSDSASEEEQAAARDRLWAEFEDVPADLFGDVAVLLADEIPTEKVLLLRAARG